MGTSMISLRPVCAKAFDDLGVVGLKIRPELWHDVAHAMVGGKSLDKGLL